MPVFSKVKVTIQNNDGEKRTETFLIDSEYLTVIEQHIFDHYSGWDIIKKSVTTGLNFEDVIINIDSMSAENTLYLCKWSIIEVDEKQRLKTTNFKSIIEETSVENASRKMTEILTKLTNATVDNVADSKLNRIVQLC